MFQPLVEAVLVYKLDGPRAFTGMEQEIVWVRFQAAYSTNNLLCLALVLLRLHANRYCSAVGLLLTPGCLNELWDARFCGYHMTCTLVVKVG